MPPTATPPADQAAAQRARRLSDLERDGLLARLDQAEGLELRDGVPLLRGSRAPWRRHDIALDVEHPGGGIARFSICTHSLSPTSLTCLHLGFLHRATTCTVHLPSVWDSFEACRGAVDLCEHVGGLVHRLDIRFREELDLRRFLDRGPVLTKLTRQTSASPALAGRIVHLEAEATLRESIRFLLRETRLDTIAAESVGAALDECKRCPPGVVLLNTEVDGWTAERVVAALREGGVVSPILLVTGETHPAKIARAKAAGVASVIELPTTEERLVEAIRPWLPTGPAADVQTLASSRAGDPAAQHLLRLYTDRLARWREELQARLRDENFDALRAICMGIKATAATAGYDALADAARRSVTALDASSSVPESAPAILGLIATLSRIKGTEPFGATPAAL